MPTTHPFRIASIDVLRALTMLLMIFVNDLWTLKDIPLWLEHTAAEADGMGLADTVFPAFLFIVGMSIPLSVLHRQNKGEGTVRILAHVITRSFALIVMGLFLMNAEVLHPVATGISTNWWYIISVCCFFILWNSWPRTMNKWLIGILKLLAASALIYLAWICRGGEDATDHNFSHYWWGILGLIGWAYFVTATIYVIAKGNTWVCIIAWLVFMSCCVANHAGWLPDNSILATILPPIGEGSMPAFVMGGVLTTLIVFHFRKQKRNTHLFTVLAICVVLLFIAGVLLRPYWGISKIRATPSWVLICSAITIAVFVLLYWLTDLKGKAGWFKLIRPAGTNTLLCYLLPYLAYVIANMSGLFLPAIVLTGIFGIIKSLMFSLFIIVVAGMLGRIGVKLKL